MIKTILVIEDERFIGEMYVRSLQMNNFDADWAVDGNDGLVMANNKKYDLILVDIMLPEKRGGQIVDELRRSNSISKNSKIIFMTNFHHNDTERAFFEKISQGYLIKSETTPRKLLEVIAKLN